MASSIIKKEIYDTGWLTLNSDVKYRKIGNTAYVFISSESSSEGTWTSIGTLPVGYRPALNSFYANVISDNTIGNMNISINTAGNVRKRGTATVLLTTILSFPVD